MKPIAPSASNHLNMIRGLAALAVVFDHDRALFLRDYSQVAHRSLVTAGIYLASGFGEQAVIIFFVLSGFFVAGSAMKMASRWSWKTYLTNRLSRLYLVLLPALLLTAIIDQFSLRMPAGSLYFNYPISHLNAVPFALNISPGTFAGNLLFLQTILVPSFGSNAPLWSLANEFWYYLLFPVVLLSLNPAGSRMRRLVYGCGAIGIVLWLPGTITIYFPIWLLGAAIHFVPRPRLNRNLSRLLTGMTLCLAITVLTIVRFNIIGGLTGDFSVGIVSAIFLFFLVTRVPAPESQSSRQKTLAYGQVAAVLAGCSYSIYAIHMPLLVFARTIVGAAAWQPEPQYLAITLAIGLATIGSGFLFSRLTEVNTDRVRQTLEGKTGTYASTQRRTENHALKSQLAQMPRADEVWPRKV